MTKRTAPKPRAVVGTPWFVRLAVYVVVAVVGLVMTVLGFATPADVDSWLGQVGSLAALIGGLLAAANTGRGSDEKSEPVEMAVPQPSVALPVEEADTFTAYPWEVGHAY